MNDLKIIEVKNKRDMRKFCNFPLQLFKGCPYYVPLIFMDEMKLFSGKLYGDYSKSHFFIAVRGKKVVGRVLAIINYAYFEKTGDMALRFSRFDTVDDFEVAEALIDKCRQIAKENNLVRLHGPIGYCDIDREGMLIEGFNYASTYASAYSYPYQHKFLEKMGFVKEVDWLERQLNPKTTKADAIIKISSLIAKRYKLRELMDSDMSIKQIIKERADEFFTLVDMCYGTLHGTVPLTQNVRNDLKKTFGMIIDKRFVSFIVNEQDKIVAIGVAIKSLAKALNKCGGKLFPFGILRLVKAIGRSNKDMELMLIAVHPDYQSKGVTSMIIAHVYKGILEDNVETIETNLTLEDNFEINNQWEKFEHIQHKRRRLYTIGIEN